MASQVPAAPPRKVRRNDKPVRVPAGVRHRHHGSRWKHRCDGDIFSCRLVWTYPDLAHEPRPRINLLLGRALRMVHIELRQCLPAARCEGPPPCGEAGARGDSSDVHLPLHQGARYYTSHLCSSIITAFHQGVHDEKMLEKLATHDVETVSTLFALADKCAKATEGRVWHSGHRPGLPK